jgi:hypothetical protein
MKFYQGEIAECGGKKVKVLTGWKSISGTAKYRVRPIQDNPTGTEFEVSEDKLKKIEDTSDLSGWLDDDFFSSPKTTKYDEKCPVCKNKWIVTKFNKQVWYDCKKCKKSKEKIVKEFPWG